MTLVSPHLIENSSIIQINCCDQDLQKMPANTVVKCDFTLQAVVIFLLAPTMDKSQSWSFIN